MKAILNLRQIETFRAVMISGSIIGAARIMNVTQPGISRTISMLEERLGYALFQRQGRGIVPTPEAAALYREVERTYHSIEHINEIAVDIGSQQAGALRVASLPAMAQWLVPRAISHFLAERPNVTVFVHGLPSVTIAELVSTGQFDVGVVEMPVSSPAIDIEEFEPDPMVAVIPSTHRLASARRVSLRDFNGERMIGLSGHSFARHIINDAFAACGAAPKMVLETANSSIACALVAAGAGLSIVTRSAAAQYVQRGIVVRPLKEQLYSRVAMIFPQITSRSKLSNAFAAELRKQLSDFTKMTKKDEADHLKGLPV